jgi:hypothetical protein
LLAVDFDFGAGSVLFVDFDKKVLLKGSGGVVEQIISDILGFESVIVFFVGVEL